MVHKVKNIILATSNNGKFTEFKKIFLNNNSGVNIVSQEDYNVPSVEESGTTFAENAILKAKNACKYTGLPAIGDDSGLVVNVIGGEPGVFSSRYAGNTADAKENVNKLLDKLKSVSYEKRTATYCCVLSFLKDLNDPFPVITCGFWKGYILFRPIGGNGFGYDPVFHIPEKKMSVAQLNDDERILISHRGMAIKLLLSRLMGSSFGAY